MAGNEIVVQDEKAQALLAKLQVNIARFKAGASEYAALLSTVVFRDIIEHFEKEEFQPFPTAPWSKIYREHMDAIGKGGNQLLQDSGRLRQSFLPTNHRLVSEGILWFNPAKTKSGFPYAYAHDTGGPKLPQRSSMWLSDEAREKMDELTLNFINAD